MSFPPERVHAFVYVNDDYMCEQCNEIVKWWCVYDDCAACKECSMFITCPPNKPRSNVSGAGGADAVVACCSVDVASDGGADNVGTCDRVISSQQLTLFKKHCEILAIKLRNVTTKYDMVNAELCAHLSKTLKLYCDIAQLQARCDELNTDLDNVLNWYRKQSDRCHKHRSTLHDLQRENAQLQYQLTSEQVSCSQAIVEKELIQSKYTQIEKDCFQMSIGWSTALSAIEDLEIERDQARRERDQALIVRDQAHEQKQPQLPEFYKIWLHLCYHNA
jgi:hypothetical protein